MEQIQLYHMVTGRANSPGAWLGLRVVSEP